MNSRTTLTNAELLAKGLDPRDPAVKRFMDRFGGVFPRLAGGSEPTYEDAATRPLLGASVSGTEITVDELLQNVEHVSRLISNLAAQRYYMNRVFAGGGGLTGGSIVYDVVARNELFATRDVQERLPGKAYPELTFDRLGPKTASVRDFGGKFWVEDEVKRRNEVGRVQRAIQRTANTLTRKLNQYTIAVLEAAAEAYSREVEDISWKKATEKSLTERTGKNTPYETLALVQETAMEDELEYQFDLAIMHPKQKRDFDLGVSGGDTAAANAALADYGITDIWVTPRMTAGQVLWVASQMPGEVRYEQPLETEVIDDREHKRTGYQSSVVPLAYVDQPYAILKTKGHEA